METETLNCQFGFFPSPYTEKQNGEKVFFSLFT